MKTFLREFKKFIMRGNVIDMSVGVIVGSAFTAIVNELTDHILRPVINWLLVSILGSDNLSGVYTFLKKVTTEELDANGNPVIDLAESIYIDWGAFINSIINFLIIAFVLFIVVRTINAINESQKRFQDMENRINWKKENGVKLTKKEKAFVIKAEARRKEEAAKKLAEEEALKNAPKVLTTEDLLVEIRDLLKNK